MEDKYAIDITTPKNPLKCHNLLTEVKNGNAKLTPEFAREFLQSTNNRKNIAVFLEVLDEHITDSHKKYNTYKTYLMALICNREQSESIKEKIAEIALKHTALEKTDKTDRDFFALLTKTELPKEQKTQAENMYNQICEKLPIEVADVAYEVAKKIKDGSTYANVSELIIQELPEHKKGFFKQLYNKIRGR